MALLRRSSSLEGIKRTDNSGLDSLLLLEQRDTNLLDDPENGLAEHEAWDRLTGGLWWDACRAARATRPDLLRAWADDPSSCWALRTLDEQDTGSIGERLGPAATRALHIARLAVLTGDGGEVTTERPARELLAGMVNAWAEAHTLPHPAAAGRPARPHRFPSRPAPGRSAPAGAGRRGAVPWS